MSVAQSLKSEVWRWTDVQELEKILKEIREYENHVCNEVKIVGYIAGAKRVIRGVEEIIRKHMNDDWIPVEKFGLPTSNEHDFRFWITIQYANGFRRTIKAKYDFFNKCFAHQNGKKILQDVIAYKYYSAPEPYRPERRI